MTIKVAIADDHPLVLSGIRHLLENCADITITGSYRDGNELLKGIAKARPDVLLLDIKMPGMGGEEAAEIIYDKYPEVKIITLTNQDDVYYMKVMLSKGVSGYILKTSPEEVLTEAIRTVYAGDQYMEAALKQKMQQEQTQERRRMTGVPELTRREKELLQYLSANLSSADIADKLCISKRTVDNHRNNLLVKLGAKNTAGLVKRAVEIGLIKP